MQNKLVQRQSLIACGVKIKYNFDNIATVQEGGPPKKINIQLKNFLKNYKYAPSPEGCLGYLNARALVKTTKQSYYVKRTPALNYMSIKTQKQVLIKKAKQSYYFLQTLLSKYLETKQSRGPFHLLNSKGVSSSNQQAYLGAKKAKRLLDFSKSPLGPSGSKKTKPGDLTLKIMLKEPLALLPPSHQHTFDFIGQKALLGKLKAHYKTLVLNNPQKQIKTALGGCAFMCHKPHAGFVAQASQMLRIKDQAFLFNKISTKTFLSYWLIPVASFAFIAQFYRGSLPSPPGLRQSCALRTSRAKLLESINTIKDGCCQTTFVVYKTQRVFTSFYLQRTTRINEHKHRRAPAIKGYTATFNNLYNYMKSQASCYNKSIPTMLGELNIKYQFKPVLRLLSKEAQIRENRLDASHVKAMKYILKRFALKRHPFGLDIVDPLSSSIGALVVCKPGSVGTNPTSVQKRFTHFVPSDLHQATERPQKRIPGQLKDSLEILNNNQNFIKYKTHKTKRGFAIVGKGPFLKCQLSYKNPPSYFGTNFWKHVPAPPICWLGPVSSLKSIGQLGFKQIYNLKNKTIRLENYLENYLLDKPRMGFARLSESRIKDAQDAVHLRSIKDIHIKLQTVSNNIKSSASKAFLGSNLSCCRLTRLSPNNSYYIVKNTLDKNNYGWDFGSAKTNPVTPAGNIESLFSLGSNIFGGAKPNSWFGAHLRCFPSKPQRGLAILDQARASSLASNKKALPLTMLFTHQKMFKNRLIKGVSKDKALAERKALVQKKRKAKKQRLETRRQKKRTRFFPRPIWLRYLMLLNFINQRQLGDLLYTESFSNLKGVSSKYLAQRANHLGFQRLNPPTKPLLKSNLGNIKIKANYINFNNIDKNLQDKAKFTMFRDFWIRAYNTRLTNKYLPVCQLALWRTTSTSNLGKTNPVWGLLDSTSLGSKMASIFEYKHMCSHQKMLAIFDRRCSRSSIVRWIKDGKHLCMRAQASQMRSFQGYLTNKLLTSTSKAFALDGANDPPNSYISSKPLKGLASHFVAWKKLSNSIKKAYNKYLKILPRWVHSPAANLVKGWQAVKLPSPLSVRTFSTSTILTNNSRSLFGIYWALYKINNNSITNYNKRNLLWGTQKLRNQSKNNKTKYLEKQFITSWTTFFLNKNYLNFYKKIKSKYIQKKQKLNYLTNYKDYLIFKTKHIKIFNRPILNKPKNYIRAKLKQDSYLKTPVEFALSKNYLAISLCGLLHLCALISLVSISQVRCFVKFHYILLYKFSNLYNTLIHKINSSFAGCFDAAHLRCLCSHAKMLAIFDPSKDRRSIFDLEHLWIKAQASSQASTSEIAFKLEGKLQTQKVKRQTKLLTYFSLNLWQLAKQNNLILARAKALAFSKKEAALGTPMASLHVATELKSLGLYQRNMQQAHQRDNFNNKTNLKSNYTKLNIILLKNLKIKTRPKGLYALAHRRRLRESSKPRMWFGSIKNKTPRSTIKYLQIDQKLFSLFKLSKTTTSMVVFNILNLFQTIVRTISNFFEKPAEFTTTWIAYGFLVEWSSDLVTIIPENVYIYIWNVFSKMTSITPSIVFTTLFCCSHSGILGRNTSTSISGAQHYNYMDFNNIALGAFGGKRPSLVNQPTQLQIQPLGLTNLLALSHLLHRRIFHLFDILMETISLPDTDLIIRQEKGTLFWDIWADFLVTAADYYNVNIAALSSIKAEQNSLINNISQMGIGPKALNQKTEWKQKAGGLFEFIDPLRSQFISKNIDKRAVNQYITYQSSGTNGDLFIDFHPPKSLSHICQGYTKTLKYNNILQQPIGSLVCHIYSGLFNKQISKNVLLVNKTNSLTQHTDYNALLIQALAGETELKIITDNAQRYALVNRGFAIGIKLLRDVFFAIALNTPCIFLLEDIHKIGERRPMLISDYGGMGDSQGSQQDEVHEKNTVVYQLTRHSIAHYKKPFKGDYSLAVPTNLFALDLFLKQPTQKSPLTIKNKIKNKNQKPVEQQIKHKNTKVPKTSPFSVLLLKEEKKFKPNKIVEEFSWESKYDPSMASISDAKHQASQIKSQISYSVRAKVFMLAELSSTNISAKLDMITDLLVIIDSVRSNKGFVVFATTNVPHVLDPALRRPGRFDETICLPNISNTAECQIPKSGLTVNLKDYNWILGSHAGSTKNLNNHLVSYLTINTKGIISKQGLSPNKILYSKGLACALMQGCSPSLIEDKGNPQRGLQAPSGLSHLRSLSHKSQLKINNKQINQHKGLEYTKAMAYYQAGKVLLNYYLNYFNLDIFLNIKSTNYLSLYSLKNKLILQLMWIFGGKIGQLLCARLRGCSPSSIKKRGGFIYNLSEILEAPAAPHEDTQGITLKYKDIRLATSIMLSFIHKHYLYVKNLILPKLLSFTDGTVLEEPPSPPLKNLLIPAKRFENYKRVFHDNFVGDKMGQRKAQISLNQKQQYHTTLNKIKQLNNQLSIGTHNRALRSNNLARANILTAKQQNNLMIEDGEHLRVRAHGTQNLLETTNINWYYQNLILKRHGQYLTNQWWNGQLSEHNAETVFLSDIDWRSSFTQINNLKNKKAFKLLKAFALDGAKAQTFIPKLTPFISQAPKGASQQQSGLVEQADNLDLLLDFPDPDQYYNPRRRRWLLNKGYWSFWFNIDKVYSEEIITTWILESIVQTYTYLHNNTELLDFVTCKFITLGSPRFGSLVVMGRV